MAVSKINVLLPIAGRGRRFAEMGYELPKPLIAVNDQIVVQKSLESINHEGMRLIFIVRQEHIDDYQIDEVLKKKFSNNEIEIISVEEDTEGAICSCLLAEEYINSDEPLVIFTPDCYFEPEFDARAVDEKYDGMVAVFESNDPAHSYVIMGDENYVIKAAEKEVISTNAVGGLYYFRRGSEFVDNAYKMVQMNQKTKGEYYICPVYNLLIADGAKIGIDKNSRHVVLGTPEGLEQYLKEEANEG